MEVFQKQLLSYFLFTSFIILVIHLPSIHSSSSSSNEATQPEESIQNNNIYTIHKQLSPKLSSQVILHGFLLWASMGFLMPIGVLIIKMSNREQCGRRFKVIFYFHVILQILSLLLATAGAIMSIKNFDNTFNNNHQRVGLGLYGIIWVQALLGLFRPKRGSKQRSIWFCAHWLIGTVITILGIMNIYTGIHAYHKRTSKSVKVWIILFTAEVCFVAFLYLLQDKWDYMKKQRVISGNEQTISMDQIMIHHNNHKDLKQRNESKSSIGSREQ